MLRIPRDINAYYWLSWLNLGLLNHSLDAQLYSGSLFYQCEAARSWDHEIMQACKPILLCFSNGNECWTDRLPVKNYWQLWVWRRLFYFFRLRYSFLSALLRKLVCDRCPQRVHPIICPVFFVHALYQTADTFRVVLRNKLANYLPGKQWKLVILGDGGAAMNTSFICISTNLYMELKF